MTKYALDGAETVDAAAYFAHLADRLVSEEPGVEHGRMMSHPAVTWGGKVFAFRGSKNDLVFRLGEKFDPTANGLSETAPLAPFKTKPPIKGWLRVSAVHADRWHELALKALANHRR